jgi:hypothetical protein
MPPKTHGDLPVGSAPLRVKALPAETEALRRSLSKYLNTVWTDPDSGMALKIGAFRWGVYAFYDYDGEPIYVGQTKEKVSTRIRRHLTNQRTDAVAMSVLDPFEVAEIEVWALPKYQSVSKKADPLMLDAREHLDALESAVHRMARDGSRFKAVLNEKDPPEAKRAVSLPASFRSAIVTEEIRGLRGHPDVRIGRRASTIARLAQVIAERQVQGGLRRTLITQAERLTYLSRQRFEALGGASIVEKESSDETDEAEEAEEQD